MAALRGSRKLALHNLCRLRKVRIPGSSAGKVVAGLANHAGTSTLSCRFDPGAGSGVLPAQIPKGMGVMLVSVTSQSKTQVGAFDLTLHASTDGTVNGKRAGGAIVLQQGAVRLQGASSAARAASPRRSRSWAR